MFLEGTGEDIEETCFPGEPSHDAADRSNTSKMAGTRKQDGEQDTAAAYFSYLLDLPKSRY